MKYILKYSYYIIIALVITAFISLVTGGIRWELFSIMLCGLYILRLLDDYFDFDRDKKEKLLSKRGLITASLIINAVFIILNLIFYGYTGLISIFLLVYMLAENKFEILKLFFLLIIFVYYAGMYIGFVNCKILLGAVISLAASVSYSLYKRGKRK